MPDFDLSAHRCRSYGREELLRLQSADVTPLWPVRKAIFSHGLWLPRHQRNLRQHRECLQTTADAQPAFNVNKRRGAACAKSPLRCGWLNARSLSNKTSAVYETIDDRQLDVLAVTETWHHCSDDL